MTDCPSCADLERKLAEERQRADEQGTRARDWYSEARLLTEKLAECEEARKAEREQAEATLAVAHRAIDEASSTIFMVAVVKKLTDAKEYCAAAIAASSSFDVGINVTF